MPLPKLQKNNRKDLNIDIAEGYESTLGFVFFKNNSAIFKKNSIS